MLFIVTLITGIKSDVDYGFYIDNQLPKQIQDSYSMYYRCYYNPDEHGYFPDVNLAYNNRSLIPLPRSCEKMMFYFLLFYGQTSKRCDINFTSYDYSTKPTFKLEKTDCMDVIYQFGIYNELIDYKTNLNYGKPIVYVKNNYETNFIRIDNNGRSYQNYILDKYNIQDNNYNADIYIATDLCPVSSSTDNSKSFLCNIPLKVLTEKGTDYLPIDINNITKECLPYQIIFNINESILADNTLGYQYEGSSEVTEIQSNFLYLRQNSKFSVSILLIKSKFCTEKNYKLNTYLSEQKLRKDITEINIDIDMIPEKCRYPNLNPDSPENPTTVPEDPNKKPEIDVGINQFDKVDGKNPNIDLESDEYTDEFEYNIELTGDMDYVTINTHDKDIKLIIPEDKTKMTFKAPDGTVQEFSIVPKHEEVTVTLSTNTKASIDAEKKVILKSDNNEKISLKQVSPKSKEFVLASAVQIEIDDVVFSGNQGMDIQLEKSGSITITNVKIQARSTGTINNAAIKNIVLAPLSNLNIISNVDLRDTSIDFPFNEEFGNQEKAPLIGDLGKSPKSIVLNPRGFQYLENKQKVLIAESSSTDFKCDEWSKTYNKGPFNTKFTTSECSTEEKDGVKIQRLYATTKSKDKGIPPGGIAGIVIACVVVVAVAIILIYFFVIKKKTQEPSENETVDI